MSLRQDLISIEGLLAAAHAGGESTQVIANLAAQKEAIMATMTGLRCELQQLENKFAIAGGVGVDLENRIDEIRNLLE